MASSPQHRCVFVGNIPYDATEEQLIQICEEVGPVVSFRLVIDRETGKPKGYGFCEYKDQETALSARRNLQGYEINGRQLRVDFAENDKNSDKREQGRGGPGMVSNTADSQKQVGGPAVGVDPTIYQPIGLPIAITAASVMAGALGGFQTSPMNQSGLPNQLAGGNDPLTHHLAKMSRSQLHQIMQEIKVLSTQNKDVARQLLLVSPQLPKALFQAQIMLGMVTPQMLPMPNIRQQAPYPSLQPSVTMQVQQPATQTVLPPLAPLSTVSQSSMAHNHFPAPLPLPLQPRGHIPNLGQMGLPPQTSVPIQSGSLSLPPVHPQHFIGPQMQTVRSVQAPPLQHVGHASQLAVLNASLQSPFQVRPLPSDPGNQAVSSVLPSLVELNKNKNDTYPQPTGESVLVGRKHSSLNVPSNDYQNQMAPSSKLVRLNDGRGVPHSSSGLTSSTAPRFEPSNAIASNFIAADQTSNVETPSKQKQAATQLQLPPDLEPALLQQVLNLTPEQLSSLPPDQQRQVIELQQMLRS